MDVKYTIYPTAAVCFVARLVCCNEYESGCMTGVRIDYYNNVKKLIKFEISTCQVQAKYFFSRVCMHLQRQVCKNVLPLQSSYYLPNTAQCITRPR